MKVENSLKSKNLFKIQKIFVNREEYSVLGHDTAHCVALSCASSTWSKKRKNWTVPVFIKLFSALGHILPNLRILSRKNNEPMLFFLFRAMTVITSISDRSNYSLVHVWKSIKKRSSLAKKENSALSEHTCLTDHTIGWNKSKIISSNWRYHHRLC